MERRKFIKYSSFAGVGASLFPMSIMGELTAKSSSQLVQFSAASTQIRHGALNLPFAKFLKEELPFDWLLDVHQNIFFKDGFQRNEAEDMHIMSIALQDGEELEALQISIQKDQISFLWKDQYITLEEFSPVEKLDLADDQYTFQLAAMDAGSELTIDLHNRKNHFVQVLKGEVQNQDAILNPNTGLGLLLSPEDTMTLQANNSSKILVISHQ